jgi:pimeloyl-ACP methyl ester carboxylesterase
MQDKSIGAATVVCVHGAGAGGWEWGMWARVLNVRGLGVIAPDLMPAARGIAATRFDDYREQVFAWCRATPAPPILVGASLGGLLALSVAAEIEPEALVLVNPMPPLGVAGAGVRTWPPIVAWSRSRSLAGTRGSMPDADDSARMHAYRRWRDESGAVLNEAQAGVPVETPSCPILVVASADDRDVPCETSRALAGLLGADFVKIAHASHVGPLLGRSAPIVAARVCDWLRACPASSI